MYICIYTQLYRKSKVVKIMNQDEININRLLTLKKIDHVNLVKYYDNFGLSLSNDANIKHAIITEFCEVLNFSHSLLLNDFLFLLND